MIFVKIEDLRVGMRLARPVYNKNGVLLFERNSKLTTQGIESIKNFALIGMFILEPAEPVPPMTQEDIDFERFQTMTVFSIQEELQKIMINQKMSKMPVIAASILKNYGHMDHKINFIQNLRSKEDYVYKHSLNVALLCTLICHQLNMKRDDQQEIVYAAIIHDIGKLTMQRTISDRQKLTDADLYALAQAQREGLSIIDHVFGGTPSIRRICMQTQTLLDRFESGQDIKNMKIVQGAKILTVAEQFDTMTAMQFGKDPTSEVAAIRFLMENPEVFDHQVVDALISSIRILTPGVSVELSTGDKALVITENKENILKPMLLSFADNSIMDLSNEIIYGDVEIVDVMKTMDNRYIMDTALLRQRGFQVDEPDYVAVKEEA